MADYADLELGLRRREPRVYEISSRFKLPRSAADRPLVRHTPVMRLDVNSLRQHETDAEGYGRKLTGALFEDGQLLTAFERARNLAQHEGVQLRIRFFIDHAALELHRLRWETLRDPKNLERTLFTNENFVCSRYLFSDDWRRVTLADQAAVKALVVIADTGDNVEGLKPVNVDEELQRARKSLRRLPVTALASRGAANLEEIKRQLRKGHDILYLVCHGILLEDNPILYLERPTGDPHAVSGPELVNFLHDLPHRPNLLVLASCHSAGTGRTGDNGVLSALGPRLAEVGIPAVVAMQGNIYMKTVELFMPVFFSELLRDGQIDRAVAAARSFVKSEGRPDWWAPVLFTRIEHGRLWIEEQGPAWLDVEPEMVRIPAGTFTIGADGEDDVPDWERPAAERHLPEYWISKSPVSVRQFYDFLRGVREYDDFWSELDKKIAPPPGWPDAHAWDARWSDRRSSAGDAATEPVQGITWFEAVAYCEWLTRKTGREYTLPSEAQWEKAIRRENEDGIEWGQVREWTRTIWGVCRPRPDHEYQYPYPEDDEARNRLNAGHYLYRVYRGKGYAGQEKVLPTTRNGFLPYHRGPKNNQLGFRVVCAQTSRDG